MGFEKESVEALEIEKKSLSYSPYTGSTVIEKKIDFDPEDYANVDYNELINLYERVQKIKSASQLDIYSKSESLPVANVEQAVEVETKLKQMTDESLAAASEISKVEVPELQVVQETNAQDSEAASPSIEIEKPIEKIEIDKPISSIEFEKETREPAALQKKDISAPEIEVRPQIQSSMEQPSIPKLLDETPDQAQQKVVELHASVSSTLGQSNDPTELKKKMLELTKELFKEKSTVRKEKIKSEIAVLKNMLAGGSSLPKARANAVVTPAQTSQKMFDTLISSQDTELSNLKDSIVDKYRLRIKQAKEKFYGTVSENTDKKQRFESFVMEITQIIQLLPTELAEVKETLKRKHTVQLEKAIEQAGTLATAKTRLSEISQNYDREFNKIKAILAHEMDATIDSASLDMFESKSTDSETAARSIISDINNTDEGTILYYLHSKDQVYYKQYELKKVSKSEAIVHAKGLMALEKGVDKKLIDKFFSEETEV